MSIAPSPRKSLGQHWLNDPASLEAIAGSLPLGASDTVLEVGPGTGLLTTRLAARVGRVIAVELDENLITPLRQDMPPNVQVVHGDILDYDLSQLPASYYVVANVPYYLTSKIVRQLSETTNPPAASVLLVQREVAERLAAMPGQLSILGVSAQTYHQVQLGPVVPAARFTPPPMVDSQVVVLQRRVAPLLYGQPEVAFFRVVRAGFSEKRKKLRSSLAGGLQLSKDQADAALQAAGIAPDARAQQLGLEQWGRLTAILNG